MTKLLTKLMFTQVAVKILSAHDSTPAEVASAEQEIKSKAYAAKACSQVVRVFCTLHQRPTSVPSNAAMGRLFGECG